jgi:hypothetical protein
MGAEATAKELRRLGLGDALELTLLIARKDPRRHPRVAARWLLRYLEEDDEVTIDELVLAASCLAALTGHGYHEAAASATRGPQPSAVLRPSPGAKLWAVR